MSFTPAELNEVGEPELRAHVQAVLQVLQNPAAPNVPQFSPFITADILRRLHELVAEARSNGHACGGWSKQAVAARVVGSFTGVCIERADAEYIGNAQETFLRDYRKQLLRATQAKFKAEARAQRAGRARPAQAEERVSQLKMRVYVCKYGGVKRGVLVDTQAQNLPLLSQAVPVKRVQYADEVNLQLKEEMIKLKHEQVPQQREMQHNLNALCWAVERERDARKVAAQEFAHAESARAEAALKAASQVQELKKLIRNAEKDCLNARGQVERLGSQLGLAHLEVFRASEREDKVRKEAEKAAMAAKSAHLEVVSTMLAEVKALKLRTREAEQECHRAKGKVARLGSQLGMAHVEVARAMDREEKVRAQAQQAAMEAANMHVGAIAEVTKQLHVMQARLKEQQSERQCVLGKMARLGSQLGSALVEAARATESAKEARTTAEELRQRLCDQEAQADVELSRLRELKAKMASRAQQQQTEGREKQTR